MSINRRLQVVLSQQAAERLYELSALTGQGRATMVSELVDAAIPALAVAAEALRKVKNAPREAQAELARYATEAVVQLGQAQLELDDVLAANPRPKRQKRNRGAKSAPP